ncbi:MAG: hypothetical protein R3A12_08790 [Ignavibacteria bacterium]
MNTYQNLFPDHVSGNPSDMDELYFMKKAWELVKPYFSQNRKIKSDLFYRDITQEVFFRLEDIIPAALQEIDTVFLENRSDIFGIYNSSTQEFQN